MVYPIGSHLTLKLFAPTIIVPSGRSRPSELQLSQQSFQSKIRSLPLPTPNSKCSGAKLLIFDFFFLMSLRLHIDSILGVASETSLLIILGTRQDPSGSRQSVFHKKSTFKGDVTAYRNAWRWDSEYEAEGNNIFNNEAEGNNIFNYEGNFTSIKIPSPKQSTHPSRPTTTSLLLLLLSLPPVSSPPINMAFWLEDQQTGCRDRFLVWCPVDISGTIDVFPQILS